MKTLFLLLTFPIRLLIRPITKRIEDWIYQLRSGPKKYKKTLFTRKPKLDSPAKAATFVLNHLHEIEWEQLAEIEKACKSASFRDSPENLVLYGCRITHPVKKMTSLQKIADRWNIAWYGNGQSMGIGLYEEERKWIKACRCAWTPLYQQAIERSLERMKNPITRQDAYSAFDPPFPPVEKR